jgi:hypothetical protein
MMTSLINILPQPLTVNLGKDNLQFETRVMQLRDIAWLQENFPNQGQLDKVFSTLDTVGICKIFLRILSDESKIQLSKIKIEQVDDEGNKKEVKTNLERLMAICDGSSRDGGQTTDLGRMVIAIMKSRGLGLPESSEEGSGENKEGK